MEQKNPEASEQNQTTAETAPAREPETGGGRTRFPSAGDLFAMLGIVLGLQVVVGLVGYLALLVAGLDAEQLDPAARGRFMAATYLCSMLPALLAILYYRRVRGGAGVGMRFSTRRLNPVLLVWAFVFMFAAGVVLEPVLSLLPAPSTSDMGRGVWTFVALVVFAPVLEELICRGVVLGSLRARYGTIPAWLLSSLFFGVLHIQPLLVVNAFVIGLVLGFIYIATESLWAAIILHALNNAIAYLLLVSGHNETMLLDLVGSRTLYVVIYVAAVAVTAASAFMVWRTLARLKAAEKNRAEA